MKPFKIILVGTLFSVVLFSSCEKTSNESDNNNNNGLPSTLSYQYNGTTYYGSTDDWWLNFDGNTKDAIGIQIDKPAGFAGRMIFYAPNCAYLIPIKDWFIVSGCSIYAYGVPFDTSAVYFYKSGSFSSTKSNCHGFGYLECDYKGNFSLTLQNKNGDTIEFKNGAFTITAYFP